MIEDDLRTMMAERTAAPPANPRRRADIQLRLRSRRRRVVTGSAVGLVLMVAAGTALTRLPGSPPEEPPASGASGASGGFPDGPYFVDPVSARVSGYTAEGNLRLDGPADVSLPVKDLAYAQVIVVRCPRPARLVLRNLGPGGPRVTVPCQQRRGDHFEGALVLPPQLVPRLYATVPDSAHNVRLEPGTPGAWTASFLLGNATEPLPTWTGNSPPLLQGTADGSAREVAVRIPQPDGETGLRLGIDCVAGVQLQLSIGDQFIEPADCDPASTSPDGRGSVMHAGRVEVTIPTSTLDRLRLRPGDSSAITVRSTGRQTDQWRVAYAR